MEFACTNAEIIITTKDRLGSHNVFKDGDRELHLFGQPEYLVRYEDLAYDEVRSSIDQGVEKILTNYLRNPSTCGELARIKGDFLIAILRDNQMEEIITPDTMDSTDFIYYCYKNDKIYFFDDYGYFVKDIDLLDPNSYDIENLNSFFISRICFQGQTYLKGLYRLQPKTIFKIIGGKVLKEKLVFFPKTDDRKFGTSELIKVIGMRMNEPEYSIAYSTGIDSHHAFAVGMDRTKQLLTVYNKRPYQSLQKTREVGAAFINSIKFDKDLTIVPIDAEDAVNIKYVEYSAQANPFKSNLNVAMYHLMDKAICPYVVTGELSDEYLCISESRHWHFSDLLTNRWVQQTVWNRFKTHVHQRRSLTHDNKVELANSYTNFRLQTGSSEELNKVADLEMKWPLSIINAMNGVTTGNIDHWNNPARYFGKKMVVPFAEPLVHYVVANSVKPLTTLLDPKRQLRKQHDFVYHADIKYKLDPGKTFIDSNINHYFHEKMSEAAPELKSFLDRTASAANSKLPKRANESKIFSYLLAMRTLEGKPGR